MKKHEYIDLVTNKPWQDIEDYCDAQPVANIVPITQLDIDSKQWIDFTKENFDHAQQKWSQEWDHYSDDGNKWVHINSVLGRNKHNTFELNYGIEGGTNEKMKVLLGDENMKRLKADPDTVLMRLIVKFPGHGVAWHKDDAGSYTAKFPDVDRTKLKRLWFSVDDWKDGHAIQISKTVLTNYNKGQVYDIPFGLGHASSNFGYSPQYTVSFTAIIND
tara:strand:- start:1292 stop:1942 length:651 start_codon:yes stop_codon:yes gene_type:complete